MVDATNGKGGFKEFAKHEKIVVNAAPVLKLEVTPKSPIVNLPPNATSEAKAPPAVKR